MILQKWYNRCSPLSGHDEGLSTHDGNIPVIPYLAAPLEIPAI